MIFIKDIGLEVKDVYDKIAKKYDEALWTDMPYNSQIDKFLSMVKGKNIIDLGCAMGSFTKYVADKGYLIDGIDISKNMIKIAKEKVKNANFYIGNMLNLKLSKKYNGAMAINSIIHIEKRNMLSLFKLIYKSLEDEGIFFLILQEGNGEKYVTEPLDKSIKEFVNFYSVDEIEGLFKESSFKIIFSEKMKDDADAALGKNQLIYYLKKE